MGKIKRERQKYHLPKVKSEENEDEWIHPSLQFQQQLFKKEPSKTEESQDEQPERADSQISGSRGGRSVNCTEISVTTRRSKGDLVIPLPGNIFKSVDINLDEMKETLDDADNDDEEDRKTVRSISKSIKSFKQSLGGRLSKVHKRKIRHEVFLKKIGFNCERLQPPKLASKKKKAATKNKWKETTDATTTNPINTIQSLPSTIEELDSVLPKIDMLAYNSLKSLNIEMPPLIKETLNKSKHEMLPKFDSVISVTPELPKKTKTIKTAKQRHKDFFKGVLTFKKILGEPLFQQNPLDAATESIQNKVFNNLI